MIKTIHILAVALSGTGFFLRGIAMLQDSSILGARWVKISPHIIDTVLLVTAIVLCVQTQQYPLEQSWVTAKVIALVAYIILGTIALKRGKTKSQRLVAYILALMTFSYMLSVAMNHHPMGALAQII